MRINQELNDSVAQQLASTDIPDNIILWLAKLKILQGIPFRYLVPAEKFLEKESLRFFHLDTDWVNSLVDGALSIGRNYSGQPTGQVKYTDTLQLDNIHASANGRALQIRKSQLKQSIDTSVKEGANIPMTGFILRSKLVVGWKSMDVIAYPKETSPYYIEENGLNPEDIKDIPILRLEALGDDILFGIFQGELYELVLHQPPEAIHFGFKQINIDADLVIKNLRSPEQSWDDPNAKFQPENGKVLKTVFTNKISRTLNMFELSKQIAENLNNPPGYYSASPDSNQKNHLISSDFALEMVSGVGLVNFINDNSPKP